MGICLPVKEENNGSIGLLPGRSRLQSLYKDSPQTTPFYPFSKAVNGYSLHRRLCIFVADNIELGLCGVQRIRNINDYIDERQPTAIPIIPVSTVIEELHLDRSEFQMEHLPFNEDCEFTFVSADNLPVKRNKGSNGVPMYRMYPEESIILSYQVPPCGVDKEALETVLDSFAFSRHIYLVVTRPGRPLIDKEGVVCDEAGSALYDISLKHDGVIYPFDNSPEAIKSYYSQVFQEYCDERHIETEGFDVMAFVGEAIAGDYDYPSEQLYRICQRIKQNGEHTLKNAYALIGKKELKKEAMSTLKLVEMSEIDEKIDSFLCQLKYSQKRIQLGKKPVCSGTLVMMGPSGVGKTTVAREIAKKAYEKGLVQTPELLLYSFKDLQGEYLGQSGPKTHDAFLAAKGRVVLIDEAYQVGGKCSGGNLSLYSSEVIAQMLIELDRINREGDTIVIFAGYEKEMDSFLSSNPGLRSRLSSFVLNFAPYNKVEVTSIFYNICGREGFDVTNILDFSVRDSIEFYFSKMIGSADYANGRSARNLFEQVVSVIAGRASGSETDDADNRITPSDIEKAIKRANSMKTTGFRKQISLV